MMVTAAMVKELREKTNAPMMACKKALEETNGDMETAIDVLRKAGEAKAAKRADKTAAEGKIQVLVSTDRRSAFIVEVNSETDFVARDVSFNAFVQKVAEQGLAARTKNVADLLALTVDGQPLEAVR